MPNVEKHPYIDASVKHVGVSKLRGLNADKLRDSTDTLVIQDPNDQPLAVLLTYEKFLAMQDELEAVARTVEMLSDNAEAAAFKEGLEAMRAGRYRSLDAIDEELNKKRG